MVVTLYKSALCPRCYLAHKYLLEAVQIVPDLTLVIVDIIASPRKTWQDGIRMIPAVKYESSVLSSFYLSKMDIENFLSKMR